MPTAFPSSAPRSVRNLKFLSGDDSLTLPFMAVGAQGVISVASNVAPREVATMVRAFAAGDVKKALQIHQKLYPLFKDLFIETNPVPVKAALAMLGLMDEEYRLPLVQHERRQPRRAQGRDEGVGHFEMKLLICVGARRQASRRKLLF